MPLHPPQDRLADPEPVPGAVAAVDARAVVAHARPDAPAPGLDVRRHGGRAVPYGVQQRLAQRPDQGLGTLVKRAVARDDQVDRDAVQLLDLGRGVGSGRRERIGGRLAAAVQPRPQLPLLRACLLYTSRCV